MFFIKEIFKSIQGEGFHTGKKSIFVRFSGCNFWNGKTETKKTSICFFCDTNFVGTNGENGGKYSEKQLVSKINNIWENSYTNEKKFVVLTGGEPLLQVTGSLVENLKKKGFYVALETNGSIDNNISCDWVCVSPKNINKWNLRFGDEVKIIFPSVSFNLNLVKKMKFRYFFLQPMDGFKKQVNIWNTINYCKSHKPWFPSFQIHKTLNLS